MKKWLIGCGMGCGFVAAVLFLIAFIGYQSVNSLVKEAKSLGSAQEELLDTLGSPEEYVPDSPLNPERFTLFRNLRNELTPYRERVTKKVASINDGGVQEDMGVLDVLGILADLKGTFVLVIDYLNFRNQLLLEQGMSMGEYTYYYTLVYHSWLGFEVTAGPVIFIEGREEEVMGNDSESYGPRQVSIRHNNLIKVMVEKQLENLDADDPLRPQLLGELQQLEEDRNYVLFGQEFPQELQELFEPHREELSSGWSRDLNRFEMGRMESENANFNLNL